MDIYEFFNSRDIAEYCKSINHEFSGLEAAFVVWHSEFHNIKQKHIAWKEILNTYPNEKLHTGYSWFDKKGLHLFLQQYMQKQKELLNSFAIKEENTVFSFSMMDCNGIDYDDGLFYDYEECLKEARDSYYGLCDPSQVSEIYILKRKIHKKQGESDQQMTLTMNVNFEPIDIEEYKYLEDTPEDEYILDGFMYFWVKIPTPFKYGDLVTVRTRDEAGKEPMILAWLPYWMTSEGRDMSKTVNGFLSGEGDFSDMQATLYYQDETGEISRDHIANYLLLEYYKGKLNGKQKLLLAINNYLQNKIWLDDLLRSHSVLLLEDYAKELKNCGKIDGIMKDSGLM